MLVEAKSNLAKLMASENIYVEQRNVETAYFDLKSRILTIPLLNGSLSSELYDLLLGHEVGHALETPEKGWHDSVIDLKVNKSILNVCEDVRIEKKIKRKFPGIRISFLKGYKELMEMDFFGVKGKDLNKFNFIDRINLHTKCGATLGIQFNKKEKKLLQEVENTETFDEVVIVAQKIQKLMRDEIQQQQKESAEKMVKKLTVVLKDDDGTESGETQKLDMSEFDEVEVIDERTKTESGSNDGDDSAKEEDSVTSSGNIGGTGYSDSMTDKSFRNKEGELHADKNAKEISYANVPELILDNIVVPHKKLYSKLDSCVNRPNSYNVQTNMTKMVENFKKFRKDSNKVVSYLVKEFEMRKNAEQQARAQTSKTGELNMSRLHDYKFTDDIFRRMTKVPHGKSHGLVMYIDWSGSMMEHLNSTVKQLLNLVLFCRKVNIPYEVYAFSSLNKSTFDHLDNWKREVKLELQTPKTGDLVVNDLTLLNLFSSSMTTKEFTHAAAYMLDYGTGPSRIRGCTNFFPPDFMTLSGTPLNEAIIAAFRMVPQFKNEHRLEIVNTVFLSDGEGSPTSQKYGYRNNIGAFSKPYETLPTSRYNVVFRDTVTKAQYQLDTDLGRRCLSTMQTTVLLKLLKQRLECNLIGFFVCSTKDIRNVAKIYNPKYDEVEKKSQEFKMNNFALIDGSGYDEYYLIRSDKLDTDDVEFEVSSYTTRGLISSFSKYNGGKIGSRIVLNRFINLIT